MIADRGDKAAISQEQAMSGDQYLTYLFDARWENLSLGYTEAPGLPALRKEIAQTYTAVIPDNVVVPAPEEGIFLTLHALLQPGDHVVVTYPGYQALYEIARSVGCRESYWQPQLHPDTHTWVFDVEELEQLVQSNTKV